MNKEKSTALKTKLAKKIDDCLTMFKDNISIGHEYTQQEIRQEFGEIVDNFMRDEFGREWEADDESFGWYENTACDMRHDAEHEAVQWLYEQTNKGV